MGHQPRFIGYLNRNFPIATIPVVPLAEVSE